MLTNLLIGGIIFGYAGWTIYRFVRRSKEGKCSGCSVKNQCGQAGCKPK